MNVKAFNVKAFNVASRCVDHVFFGLARSLRLALAVLVLLLHLHRRWKLKKKQDCMLTCKAKHDKNHSPGVSHERMAYMALT